MRLSIWLTTIVALIITAAALMAAWAFLRPGGPPLASAEFSFDMLTPNADGEADVVRIRYTLRRAATVSIYFLNARGERFDFRKDRPRQSGENVVDFSGIVNPYHLPDDTFTGEILARVLQNGVYTWVVEAVDAQGERNQITGALAIQGADTTLPEIANFSLSPPRFTPNRDGLDDRVEINLALSKDVDPNGLRVFLIGANGANGAELPISEKGAVGDYGRRGVHRYDYDGGIDLGQNPPPDGDYVVRAEAEDRLGQKTAVTSQLTIAQGGLPRAEIAQAQVDFSATTLLIGQTLYFTLTVENYGNAPIRTSGPFPGYVYGSMKTNFNATGYYEESGAFRVGLMCQTCKNDYPWRWALGSPETLAMIPDANGNPQYYLLKGQSAIVTGGIVLDEIVPSRNPQYFWAGLIHEDVEIAAVNNRVDPHVIEIHRP
jgi:hypothetical protein